MKNPLLQNRTEQSRTNKLLLGTFAVLGIVIIVSQAVVAQTGTWSINSNTTNSIFRTGDVGIGMTTTPSQKLEVAGNIKQGNNLFYSDAGNSTINFNCRYDGTVSSAPFKLFTRGFSGVFNFGVGQVNGGALTYATGAIGFANDLRDLTPRFTILNSGLVGIGTTNPTELLQISGGNLQISNGQFRQGNNYLYSDPGNSTLHFNSRFVGGATPFQKFATGFSGCFNFNVGGDGSLSYSTATSGSAGSTFTYLSRFAILNNGAVAIGPDAGGSGVVVPAGYLLAVKGKIICQELKVKLYSQGWPDYVFDKKYHLLSLPETERFIDKNQHLPNMPSAKQLEEQDGISVSEIITKQQEKIEELTLHLIEHQKMLTKLIIKLEDVINKTQSIETFK